MASLPAKNTPGDTSPLLNFPYFLIINFLLEHCKSKNGKFRNNNASRVQNKKLNQSNFFQAYCLGFVLFQEWLEKEHQFIACSVQRPVKWKTHLVVAESKFNQTTFLSAHSETFQSYRPVLSPPGHYPPGPSRSLQTHPKPVTQLHKQGNHGVLR